MAIDTPARIAVLGAGPIGLEAALYARYLGYEVDVYERGTVADSVLRWGHVRMLTPFGENRSPLGLAALKAQDPEWQPPADDALVSGRQWAETYLVPLAHSDLLADSIHEHAEVVAIGRDGPLPADPADDEARLESDFRLLLRDARPGEHGREWNATADVVIDATGTYHHPNRLGHGGIAAIGEQGAQTQLEYGLPDVLGRDRAHYASRNILLVGDGLSAATSLVGLAQLASQSRDTWITWITRRPTDESAPQPVAPVADDPLAERARVTAQANQLAASDANHVTWWSGTTVAAISYHADLDRFTVRLLGKHAGEVEFDRIVANVGYCAEPRIHAGLHVRPGGAADDERLLIQPEPDFYILGSKSHAGADPFLISNGLEQIRELFAILGDRAELNLYATMAGLY